MSIRLDSPLIDDFAHAVKYTELMCKHSWVKSKTRPLEAMGRYMEAADFYLWLYRVCSTYGPEDPMALRALALLLELSRLVDIAVSQWKKQLRRDKTFLEMVDLQVDLKEVSQNRKLTPEVRRLKDLSSMLGRLEPWNHLVHSSSDGQQKRLDKVRDELMKQACYGFTETHLKALTKGYQEMEDSLSFFEKSRGMKSPRRLSSLKTTLDRKSTDDKGSMSARLEAPPLSPNEIEPPKAGGVDCSAISKTENEGMNIGAGSSSPRYTKLEMERLWGSGTAIDSTIHESPSTSKPTIPAQTSVPAPTTPANVHVGQEDILGRTLLHYAAANPHAHPPVLVDQSMGAALLENLGLDPNARDLFGWTPLHYAAWCGNSRMVRLLLEEGAETEVYGPDGMTPLHFAAATESNGLDVFSREINEVVEFLLEAGASCEAQDNCKRTPLHWAASRGWTKIKIVKALLDKGAFTRARETYGRIPLHLAGLAESTSEMEDGMEPNSVFIELLAAERSPDRVRCLNIKDREGRTVLDLAVSADKQPRQLERELQAHLDRQPSMSPSVETAQVGGFHSPTVKTEEQPRVNRHATNTTVSTSISQGKGLVGIIDEFPNGRADYTAISGPGTYMDPKAGGGWGGETEDVTENFLAVGAMVGVQGMSAKPMDNSNVDNTGSDCWYEPDSVDLGSISVDVRPPAAYKYRRTSNQPSDKHRRASSTERSGRDKEERWDSEPEESALPRAVSAGDIKAITRAGAHDKSKKQPVLPSRSNANWLTPFAIEQEAIASVSALGGTRAPTPSGKRSDLILPGAILLRQSSTTGTPKIRTRSASWPPHTTKDRTFMRHSEDPLSKTTTNKHTFSEAPRAVPPSPGSKKTHSSVGTTHITPQEGASTDSITTGPQLAPIAEAE